jgi:acyl-CoA reductase-like NAD-dependent aldehyde dehydrogenase
MSDQLTPEEQELFSNAHRAAEEFSTMHPDKVQKIYSSAVRACIEKLEFYAEWAVKETGFGHVGDKIVKNYSASGLHMKSNNAYKFANPKINHLKKTVSFPKPAGVVVALIPCTNPVATVFLKCMHTLVTRNSIILCPHPAAIGCCNHAAKMIAEVAEAHGAPKGAIQWLEKPSVEMVGRLMKSDQTDVILATGGAGMVRAAYSSGNPALGVGCANVPCYVDRSAKIKKAAHRIAQSVCFDNSLPCTTESTVLADMAISEKLKVALTTYKSKPAVWVEGAELERLRSYLYPGGRFNPHALGLDADIIAANAGFTVPAGTRTLLVEIDHIGFDEPFSAEKMCPVLAYLEVEDKHDGLAKAQEMLNMMGKGHSAVIHAQDNNVIAMFGQALPVCRISVNVSGVSGSSGSETNLPASAVIGTGFFGRSSVDHNITPDDLIQWTTCAYNVRPNVLMGAMELAIDSPSSAAMLKNKAAMAADFLSITSKCLPMLKKYY